MKRAEEQAIPADVVGRKAISRHEAWYEEEPEEELEEAGKRAVERPEKIMYEDYPLRDRSDQIFCPRRLIVLSSDQQRTTYWRQNCHGMD